MIIVIIDLSNLEGMKTNCRNIFRLSFLSILIIISGCDKNIDRESGFLEGTISIGPICPVETDPPQAGCLPTAETYKAYPVSVWTADGSIKVAVINPELDGSFKTELAPGNYRVILEKQQNMIGGSNLPMEVTIKPSEKTSINVEIDTGIR
jgi:hypothetical protein